MAKWENRMIHERYDVLKGEVDSAAHIVLEKLNEALKIMSDRDIDAGASVQAATQMTMRLYADLIQDDLEAIRQIRKFLDGWERDVLDAPGKEVH